MAKGADQALIFVGPDSYHYIAIRWGQALMSHAEFILNVGTALLLGIAIGIERQWRQHTAGLRTNTLVALGAALFVSLSKLMGAEQDTRIASYVVSGLGFLGGGVILREGLNVRGLNTAATLWCSGAVGVLAGSGYHSNAAIGTAFVLFVHLGLRPLVRRIEKHALQAAPPDVEMYYRIRVTCSQAQEAVVRTILLRHVNSRSHMTVQGLTSRDEEDKDRVTVTADVFSLERDDRHMEEIVARIGIEPGVSSVSWEKNVR
jgi:putative Mg2+ transporter-C (MgtC) family protein